MRKTFVLAIGAALCVGGGAMGGVAGNPVYFAANWANNSIHTLDANFNSTGSFVAGGSLPNGVTNNGSLIWSGHFINSEVIAYDMTGAQQFSWSSPLIGGLQGLEYISNAEIAAASGDLVHFLNPFNGAFVRDIPAAESGTIEGLAYDGAATLFQLGSDNIYATDVNTGAVMYTLANPAISDPFGGTGITYIGGNTLAVASANGNWYTIDATTGGVFTFGNNGLEMYGLSFIPAPGALALLGVAGLLGGRRRRD